LGSTAAVSMSCSRVRNEGPATSSRSIINCITVSARSGSKATILSYTFSITVSIRLSSSFIAHLQRRKTCSSVSGHCRTLLRIAVKYSRPNAAVLLVGRWPRRIRLICSGSRGFVFRNSERGARPSLLSRKGVSFAPIRQRWSQPLVVRGFHYCQGLHLLADPAQFAQMLTRSVYRPLASRNFRNAILGTF
jgi:hypothetical protein